MKIERKIEETIEAGALTLVVQCDRAGVPEEIELLYPDSEHSTRRVLLTAEQIEQAAAIIADRREDAGDRRNVCPTHGYYGPRDRYSPRLYECPKCEEERAAAQAPGLAEEHAS